MESSIKDKSKNYQNDVVNYYVNWTDNFHLGFHLLINEGMDGLV
jgi:deoxyadenosine/deoxycytidine kinase